MLYGGLCTRTTAQVLNAEPFVDTFRKHYSSGQVSCPWATAAQLLPYIKDLIHYIALSVEIGTEYACIEAESSYLNKNHTPRTVEQRLASYLGGLSSFT